MHVRRPSRLLALAFLAVTLPALVGAAPRDDPAPADRPEAELAAPTAQAPSDSTIGGTFQATVTATHDGRWSLQYRGPGEADFTDFVDPDAHGRLAADEPVTVTVDAPAHAGTYDLRLDFVGDDRKRDKHTEVGALVVSGAPQVVLTSPTAEQPALVGPGDPVEVAFTSTATGNYTIGYRASQLPGRDFAAFPAGTGIVRAGEPIRTSVQAPGTPGAFDVRVVVTTGSGEQGSDLEDHAVLVARPDLLPSDHCDDLDPRLCLLPFPNDRFTVADPATTTGRRVNFDVRATPRNVAGKPLDPTEWNRQDGFSPGSLVITYVPGLDLHATWGSDVDHIADLGRFEQPDAPIVLLDADTGERHPFWSELDVHAQTPDDDRVLLLRPAVNLTEGHRYIVALRDLKTSAGTTVPAGEHFAHLRDGTSPTVPDLALEARRAHHERLFAELEDAGIARDDLYLAWDFTVASADNIAGRVLSMRDDAFGRILGDHDLGDGVIPATSQAPEIAIDYVVQDGSASRWVVHGAVKVPNYLDRPQRPVELARFDRQGYDVPAVMVPGSRMRYDPVTGKPMQNPAEPWMEAPFICAIPETAVDADGRLLEPAIPVLYGHGLLGSRQEGAYWSGGRHMLQRQNSMNCGVDWIGMAEQDLANVGTVLVDGSNFPSLADRAQQGFLNFLFVGRAMIHPDGFASLPEFRTPEGTPVFDRTELFYDGNSQGAIMGGAVTALAPDFTKAVLGVPGMNYSTLLNRSVDWEGELVDPEDPGIPAYSAPFYAAYPDVADRQLMFALMQMLWDRAESNGYAHHATDDPYPNTPAHQVLLHVAWGDFQVANVAAEVMGRTMGTQLLPSALPEGRHWALDPTWGFRAFSGATEVGGSALIYFDSGNLAPPNSNTPPADVGSDPHGHPRNDTLGGVQKRRFFDEGIVYDTRSGAPWFTDRCPGVDPGWACTSNDA